MFDLSFVLIFLIAAAPCIAYWNWYKARAAEDLNRASSPYVMGVDRGSGDIYVYSMQFPDGSVYIVEAEDISIQDHIVNWRKVLKDDKDLEAESRYFGEWRRPPLTSPVETIKKYMADNLFTIADLCDLTGIPASALNRILSGEAPIVPYMARIFSDLIGYDKFYWQSAEHAGNAEDGIPKTGD